MPAPTLYDLAKMRLIQNIYMLNDIGDLPYSFLAPVLRHIQNPAQLLELEQNCPQILGETGEIWLRFIKRDIPNWDRKPHQPRDPRSWNKVYKKLKKEAEQEKAQQEEALKEQMRALQQSRAGNQTLIMDGQTGYNPGARRKGFNFGGSRGSTSWGNPAAPAKTGKQAFDKLRKGIFDQKQARPKATQMPTHLLAERRATVKQAPERLLRMAQNERKNMVISKQASASIANRSIAAPTLHRPNITARPVPQQDAASSEKSQRTSLPTGQHYTAPKFHKPSGGPTLQKRKREEPSLFHQPKKKRV